MSDNTEMEYKCKCAIDCQRTHRECELRAEDNLNLCKEIDRLNKQLTQANTLLEVAVCPDDACENGIIPTYNNYHEPEAQQCQWCYERKELLTKLKSKGNE